MTYDPNRIELKNSLGQVDLVDLVDLGDLVDLVNGDYYNLPDPLQTIEETFVVSPEDGMIDIKTKAYVNKTLKGVERQ